MCEQESWQGSADWNQLIGEAALLNQVVSAVQANIDPWPLLGPPGLVEGD